MNIFFLSGDPQESAKWMVDRHVVKMPLESAQMLCTAHRILDNPDNPILYKITHKNHPCAVWSRTTSANYIWLYNHFIALCKEYQYRYDKIHLCYTKLHKILKTPPKNISAGPLTPPAQAMPEEFKNSCSITAYRNYYKYGKSHLFRWTKRMKPYWIESLCQPTSMNVSIAQNDGTKSEKLMIEHAQP